MDVKQFEQFLQSIDLKAYRDTYRPVKLVEMDLPKEIQAIELMYEIYWKREECLSFERFYKTYHELKGGSLESFRNKIGMCETCFYKGLPARIYRTWASIITQIHAGYVADAVFGPGAVSMSAELDHQGADFQVVYKKEVLNYQVKKNSYSREVRQAKKVKNGIEGRFIDIKYEVPSDEYFKNPNKKDGTLRLPYRRFIENPELKRFGNGFVVFTPHVFEVEKKKIDKLK